VCDEHVLLKQTEEALNKGDAGDDALMVRENHEVLLDVPMP